jgi:hypothetical protein
MNDFPMIAAVLAYLPLKAALLLIIGFGILRGLKVRVDNLPEALCLSFTFGFAAIYVVMLVVIFGGSFSQKVCLALGDKQDASSTPHCICLKFLLVCRHGTHTCPDRIRSA